MTRPIVWAAGTLAAIGLAAAFAGDRLAAGIGGFQAARAPALGGSATADRSILVQADARGHFEVRPYLEGRPVTMMVDTGASMVALTSEDAAAAGISVGPGDFSRSVGTANGQVAVAPVRIRELRIGDIAIRDVEAVVLPAGRLGTSLLGMSFLRRLRGFEIANGRLTLKG